MRQNLVFKFTNLAAKNVKEFNLLFNLHVFISLLSSVICVIVCKMGVLNADGVFRRYSGVPNIFIDNYYPWKIYESWRQLAEIEFLI